MIYETVAAVDLGSNSFRLQVGRVVEDQIYPLDSLKEPVRLASGLTEDKRLDAESQARALYALRLFGERLRGLDAGAVRAVATNSLRVAKKCRRVPAPGRRSPGLSHRNHRRPGRGAPDLHRRLPLPAQRAPQAPGGGYWRRFHRIHHRQAAPAPADGIPVHGLRQLHPALLPQRQGGQEAPARGPGGGGQGNRADRPRLPEPGLEGSGGFFRFGPGHCRHIGTEQAQSRWR